MKKLIVGAAAVPLILLVLPLLGAAVLVASSTAAADQAGSCTTVGTPPTGRWRPPAQHAYTLTSRFGPRIDPITGASKIHTGADLVTLPGPGPVVAAAAGTVTTVGSDPDGYGTYVTIEHGGGISTLYAHLVTTTGGITTGAPVAMGQQVGVEGATGHTTGNHLHYEVRSGNTPIDPVAFMLDHGAPLDGTPVAASPAPGTGLTDPSGHQGGIGFALPGPGTPRLASLSTPPAPIPERIKALYVAAADRYQLPWTLLAGIGMAETGHGEGRATSTIGAQGLMQFLPATWARYGIDGSGDGRADIHDDADSVMSAANYLTASGVTTGGVEGVRQAIFAYNHADWYLNDVLYYAQQYGAGTITGDPSGCGPGGDGSPTLPPVDNQQIQAMLSWAGGHVGNAYVMGANGPTSWDCSSFTKAAYARIGITLPRTAAAQRDWLAHGNGTRITPGQEQPGDLIFTDSYLGPGQIGHVAIVWDPATKNTIEAANPSRGVGHFTYTTDPGAHHIAEIWRVAAAP